MVIYFILSAIIGVFGVIMGLFPTIETLPYGIDEALVFFVGTIKGILEIFPWFQTIWNLMLLALFSTQ